MKGFAAAAVVTAFCAINGASAAADGLKIGYVNGFRVENESATALRAFDVLRTEFTPREKALAQLEKQIADLKAESDKAAKSPASGRAYRARMDVLLGRLRNTQQNFSEDLEARRREEHARVIAEANAAIRTVAEAGHYDLIVQDAIYSDPGLDITDRVLNEMRRRLNAANGARTPAH